VSAHNQQGNEPELSETITTGLLFSLTTSTLIAVALFILASPVATYFLQQPELAQLLRVASFSVIGAALVSSSNAVFIGYMRPGLQNITTILSAILRGITSAALVILGLGPLGAIIGYASGYLIVGASALVFAIFYLRASGVKREHVSMEELKILLRFGLPIYLSNLIAGGLGQILNSLMVLYVGNPEIGSYGAALNFTFLISFLTVPIQTTIYPLFSRIKRDSPNLKNAYENAVKYSTLVALPGALALMGLSNPVIQTIYGDKFPGAALYLSIYMVTYIPIGVGSSCQMYLLNSQGETGVNMWKNVISLALGAPLAFLLIPRFGIIGLIASTIASGIIPTIYGHIWIKRHLKLMFEGKSSARIYLSSIVALVATVAIQYAMPGVYLVKLVTGGMTFAVVYLLVLKVTHTLGKPDYDLFRSILGSTGPLSNILMRLLKIYENL
jgi:O-antigen/teichoic acid export membrane protein